MTCPLIRTPLSIACLLVLISCTSSLQAAPKSEQLLPDTTKCYISVANAGVLRESFNRTQWGQLVHDPAMQPFVEDFRHQLQQKGGRQLEELGLSWQELEGVPGGELSIALVRPEPGRMAFIALIDVTGHREQAAALLQKIGTNLTNRGAMRVPVDVREGIEVFNLPASDGQRSTRQAAFFLKGDLLAAANDVGMLRGVLAATAAERPDSLAQFKPFREIADRCGKSTAAAPQIRWFVEPFGYAMLVRETATGPRRKGIDILTALKNQGFTAVQGVGGSLSFSSDQCELVHRTMVYAPPVAGREGNKDKYDLAARMLKFPNSTDLEPQSWVPNHVATYNTFNWDIKTAFSAIGPLVDEVSAEKGVFHDVLDSLKNDPQGPQVDIEKDLVGNLSSRVTVITDYQLPIGPKSERLLVAVETSNEALVAETIAKTMKGDAARREFEGHVIWEIVDEDCAVPELKIEDSGAINPADRADQAADKKPKDRPLMQNAAITVAFGHLFVASNLGFLETVLHQAGKSDGLAASQDYRFVANKMSSLGAGELSFRLFSRTDEEYRPTYELIRTGQMPRAETVLGQVLNALMGEGKDGVLRKQKIDGSKLPPFETVSHYFGPAGTFVTSEPNGWFIVGFTLDKAQMGQAMAKNDALAGDKAAATAAINDDDALDAPSLEAPAPPKPMKQSAAPAPITGRRPDDATVK